MKNKRTFGIIPAAGHSRRMGTHKLLMPWNDGRVIDCVLQAWTSSCVDHTVMAVRSDDKLLIEAAQLHSSIQILALNTDTQDMKQTIQTGLEYIQSNWSPIETDRCLIAPADLPKLTHRLIDEVANAIESKIVVPIYGNKTGHPSGFPWVKTREIFELNQNEGLDALIKRSPIKNISFDISLRPRDIDTPDDYTRERESAS